MRFGALLSRELRPCQLSVHKLLSKTVNKKPTLSIIFTDAFVQIIPVVDFLG